MHVRKNSPGNTQVSSLYHRMSHISWLLHCLSLLIYWRPQPSEGRSFVGAHSPLADTTLHFFLHVHLYRFSIVEVFK